MTLSRRRFLAGAGTLAGAAVVGNRPSLASVAEPALPHPAKSGIDHVIVVMMENRSFDHYLGWLPGSNGRQAGLSYADADGNVMGTHHLADFQGCDHPDPDHSFEGGRVQYDDGRCDGFLRSGDNDEFAIGYYTADDLDFYAGAAPAWTVCDKYFSAIMAETYPNRFYQHAAQTDRIHNSFAVATMPTIWDRLSEAGLSGKYYFNDAPFLALWGSKYTDISAHYADFLADCAAGTLPTVSYVDPRFLDEGSGTSGDDHPHADIRVGQYFLNEIYDAVTSSPAWANTVLVINYDEWGGFFDHVAPTIAPDANPEWGLRGFRVPCLVISPRARRGHVDHRTYDHTSILRMIEWRWNLAPLTPRDASARNLARVLDFSHPPQLDAPAFSVPAVAPTACQLPVRSDYSDWESLRDLAAGHGWDL